KRLQVSEIVPVSRLTASTKSQPLRNISKLTGPLPPTPQTRQLKNFFFELMEKRSWPVPQTGHAPTYSPVLVYLLSFAPCACASFNMSLARACSTRAFHSSRLITIFPLLPGNPHRSRPAPSYSWFFPR